jgi:hypothetical protein
MGRKKVDKDSMEWKANNLFHKEDIIGFQFTAGNTPLGVMEDEPLEMHCVINKSRSTVVIDGVEFGLAEKISEYIFGKDHTIDMEKLRDYQRQFRDLGYEVEEDADFAGEWYWFRVKCKHDEILEHVKRLKDNLII